MLESFEFNRAFTLLELLAVLVVLALSATLGVGMLGRSPNAHARLQAITTLQEMLERSRLLADGRGGATLTLGATLTASPIDADAQPASIARALPRGWSASVLFSLAAQETLRFAADGSCADCRLALTGPEDQFVTMRVLGLTGQCLVADDSEVFP